jgi:hypothetical protein
MSQEITGKVKVTGVINDEEFAATGEVAGDPEAGRFRARLAYEHVPANWHPIMYTDVKAGLLFYREVGLGQNFLSLADGTYTAAGHIDLGGGALLRNHAVIELLDEHTFRAAYVMHGIAPTGPLAALEHFEETMIPMGPGRVGAVAFARWKREDGSDLDAMFSTRFDFPNKATLAGSQLRTIVASPRFEFDETGSDLRRGGTFTCEYDAVVRDLPTVPEDAEVTVAEVLAA